MCKSGGAGVKCNFSTIILLNSHDAFGVHVWRTVGIGQQWMEVGWARIGCGARRAELGYHLAEGSAWLSASDAGANSTQLSYAAFELRLEIERIAFEFFLRLNRDR